MLRSLYLMMLLFISQMSWSQDLVQWRGVNRDGKYQDAGLLKSWPAEGPHLLWHFDELGDGHSSATVTQNAIYLSGTEGENGFVLALDHSGKMIWKSVYGKEWMDSYDGVRTTPLFCKGMIYMLSGYGQLFALNAANGQKIWSINVLDKFGGENIRWGLVENLLIEGDKLFCTPGGSVNNIVAVNRKTGELIWHSSAKGEKSAYCSPALVKLKNRSLLVTHTQNSIVGIDTKDGKMLWSVAHQNRYSIHPNTPIFKDSCLYCVSGYGKGGLKIQLLDNGERAKVLWHNEELDNQMGGVILLGDKLYGAGHTNREWFCVDWETGKTLYSSKMLSKGNIIYADGLLYCYGESGEVALVDISKGNFNKVSSFRVPFGEKQHWSHMVIHNKRLYIRHGNFLMVYSLES